MSDHAHETSPVHDHDTPHGHFGWGDLARIGIPCLVVGGVAALIGGPAPAVAFAGAVAAAATRRHGWHVRAQIAAITAIIVFFAIRMMPSTDIADITAPPAESHSLLSWIVGFPIAGAIAILFTPRQAVRTLRALTLGLMFATLGVAIPLLRVPMDRGFHFNQDIVWMARFGIHYHLAIDGVSLWLVLLTVVITPIATFASFGSIETRIKDWCFALLLLEGGLLGAFLAVDLFLFYVFWELMLIPMYVMIGVWGGKDRIRAAIKFFLYTMFGSVLMLAAILYVAYAYGQATHGPASFDYFELQRLVLPRHVQTWVWLAFTLSFVIKVPMFPVHTWLPDAHTEAPTAGSVILAAVMLKLGTYGYLRFSMGLFPEASAEWAANLAGVAVIGGILYGALCAWKQDDFKRLVAYSSIAHLGYVMLGLFAATSSSLEGAVLQMVNHGITTGALFLLVGVIYDRRHTRMLAEFGGLARPMPVYATLFIIATLASIGLPGTNGFVGEFMVITGTFVSTHLGHFNGVQAIGATIGVILGAVYMLSCVQKVFFGRVTKSENKYLADVDGRELVAIMPLVLMIFVIGLFPNIFLSQIKGAAARVRDEYSNRLELHPPDPAGHYYDGPIKLLSRRPDAPRLAGAPAPVANEETH